MFINQIKAATLFVVLLMSACGTKNSGSGYSQTTVNRMLELGAIQPPLPLKYGWPFYCMGARDTIHQTNLYGLEELYKYIYAPNYKDFSTFCLQTLNQLVTFDKPSPINKSCFTQSFVKSKLIIDDYQKWGIKFFIEKYCYQKEDYYILKQFEVEDLNTISYIFFINGYIRLDDDSIPLIKFQKLDKLMEVYAIRNN